MRIMVLILMLLIMTGLFVNAGRQAFLWLLLVFKGASGPIFGVIFGLVVVAVLGAFVASRIPGLSSARSLFLIGHYALGVLVYIVIIFNVASLLPLPHKAQWIAGTVSLLLVAGLSIYGSVHAREIRTRTYTVQTDRGKAGADELRIALVSDIHLGYVIDENHLAKVVKAVNALKPDVVCIAGDLFDGDITSLSDPGKLQALFQDLESKYGVYACLGNHDAGAGYRQMLEFLKGADVRVLMDEAIVVDNRFVLAGRRDSSPIGGQGEARTAVKGLPKTDSLPVIVMDHQPGNIGQYGNEVDLIMSGHTHQGQMFPFNLITNAVFDVDYGYYRAAETSPQVVVTSGAGTWGPPMRVATDCEIVEIRLQ